MEYDEPTTWQLCGVEYRTTMAMANKIASLVFETPEWVSYATNKDLVAYGTFNPTSPEGRTLVRDLVISYRAAFNRTLEIAKRELGDA